MIEIALQIGDVESWITTVIVGVERKVADSKLVQYFRQWTHSMC
jgi:hypothetical protein